VCRIRYKGGRIAERVRSGEEFRMSEEIQQTRVTFNCGGVELAGYLYRLADATGKLPCVVMGHD
jgi:hypothetical protein